MASPHFTPKATSFLRSLERHNDRDWFKARKEQYEQLLREPMIAVIAQLADDFRRFAPDLVASPKASLYRVYRDTRFSGDKKPLKTHIGAIFPTRGLPKHQGAGLYVEIGPRWVWAGGGMYMPEPAQLLAVREHIAANSRRLRAIVESPRFTRAVGPLEGRQLTRVPRGFPADHEAAHYLKFKQFVAGREYPDTLASSRQFYPTILRLFQHLAPLVHFLNEPLVRGGGTASRLF